MKKNPESLIDRHYAAQNNLVIIPNTKNESNTLTKATENLYRYIDTFETLNTDLKNQVSTDLIHQLLIKIDNIIMNTPNIKFTSFCQYFLVTIPVSGYCKQRQITTIKRFNHRIY
ncbi:MAG: hypothetical protein IKJ28_05675 [Alphaproteobacteria bacterium]|nr:hypothetical protein [Alphaproteobacteria bacterium]